ncbi:MAG TPA: nickel-dependent lactate racemase [Acidimicrobiales bacterium]|nr:nickel-dependent lactate racemase [Acidimicrobiales bacterium]
MRVDLAFGRQGTSVAVPDGAEVIAPVDEPGLRDEAASITAALRRPLLGPPLHELTRGAARIAVVFPDLTRPMPNRTVLPPLLAELARCGVPDDRITLLCATGTHRQASAAEMEELVGREIVARYGIVDHDGTSAAHVEVGTVDGTPVLLQREYVEADVRIITGFVEPHFFAGFSGGPKAVCPGLAANSTILEAHHPRRIADSRATFVTRDGNPVHDFVRAATALAPPHLSLDVAINRARRVTAVFAGPLPAAHDAACAHVQSTAVRVVDAPFDLVVSTNGGYPLDRNLYQAVKGMAAAERIVRPGGFIVMAAACEDGVPAGGAFARLLAAAHSTADLLGASGEAELDRWQAQVLGRVLARAQVHLFAPGLDAGASPSALLSLAPDLDAAVAAACTRLGPGARVAVMPEGPLTVATVATVGDGPAPAR